jgi:hemerythrin-like domain-containing protein
MLIIYYGNDNKKIKLEAGKKENLKWPTFVAKQEKSNSMFFEVAMKYLQLLRNHVKLSDSFIFLPSLPNKLKQLINWHLQDKMKCSRIS